jgi:hypothetical protein
LGQDLAYAAVFVTNTELLLQRRRAPTLTGTQAGNGVSFLSACGAMRLASSRSERLYFCRRHVIEAQTWR